MRSIVNVHTILYVADQVAAARFYQELLGIPPRLDVPGMTEFEIGPGSVLGLMPVASIRRLLGSALRNPDEGAGIPRCEIYLVVDDAEAWHRRAIAAGATELSGVALRNWGHRAGYSVDRDGHVIAFAEEA